LILEGKVVVKYSNCNKEPGSTLHDQTMLTGHLHMETGEAMFLARLTSI